mmetsp:Transcript_12481/g.26567  ORF Transcript_12481/g.26567 Transcript_12481/m.26567 type:complete len:817 (+) Transcript_12481:170-2620(+)
MAKKERRSKGSAAKQAALRRSQKSSSPASASWKLKNMLIVVVVSFTALTVLLMFVARSYMGDDDGESDGHLIPHIDGVATGPDLLDPERENKTRYFLNSFVCDYQPDAELVKDKGYCHPRLSSVPEYRTQKVSTLNDPVAAPVVDSPTSTNIFKNVTNWLTEMLHSFTSDQSESDRGIPKGEIVMRLPRPLQVWDLDALRDNFIQQEFLGLGANDDNNDDDEMEEGTTKAIARHEKTQNPLDSGAFLAVYLIRLSHGSRGKKKSSNYDNNEQCQDESGECKMLEHWDDFDQLEDRIGTLSGYLDVLPTVTNRIMMKTSTSEAKPHSHPLFWSSRGLQALFPPNTHTHDLIRHYQQMVESEYEALKLMSDEFEKNVKYMEYLNMRVNVLSRAFGLSASENDNGVSWGIPDDTKEPSLVEEMKGYETSNFGSFLDEEKLVYEFKLRSMCPLLDMYNSHPNPNVGWKYDKKSSSYVIDAVEDVSPGHSIVVSYGKYTDGHMFAKYGYVNGDGSSPTEISLAVFHRILGDIGLGRQYSQLPFGVWDPRFNDELIGELPAEVSDEDSAMQKSLSNAKQALEVQAKELMRYLMFDDGYDECIDLASNPNPDEHELKLLKLRHLIRVANYREVWTVRIPPQFPTARPLQILGGPKQSNRDPQSNAVGLNANRIISVCRLLSMTLDDIEGDAIEYLRDALADEPKLSSKYLFLVPKHGDELEYRALMCVVRLCNVALSRYVGYDNAEPEPVGSKAWNAWYITTGEVRGLGTLLQTAASEANRVKRQYQLSKGPKAATNMAAKMREEGACPLNYTFPLLKKLDIK